jgi:3-mercaptopyruvate sulfurtransferase SseA
MTATAVLALTLGVGSAQMKVTPKPGAPAPMVPVKVPELPLESAKRIERAEAMKLVKLGKAVYVDVRSKETFDEGHIKGALGIPGSQLLTRLKEIPPGRMIITYCA